MSEPTITLHSSGLLSRRGFDDGDAPDQWWELLDERGIDQDDCAWPLAELVRCYLLPELRQHHDIDVYEIDTNHNPIRAQYVDGVEIDVRAANDHITLTPASVDVSLIDALVIALAQAPQT